MKVKAGQTIWLTGGFNKSGIRESKIKSVGRKWFTIEEDDRKRFDIDTLKDDTQYSQSAINVWLDKQELEDSILTLDLSTKLRHTFNGWGKLPLSLDQMKRIAAIIDENTLPL